MSKDTRHPGSCPQISVILPAYNGEQYLKSCIRSVLGQSLANFEFLIADDCSTDDSRHIIQGFADRRIRFTQRQHNQGLFPNLNQLVVTARAPLLRFLGQDDILESECLENEVRFFDQHPAIGMSFCKACFIDARGHQTGQSPIDDLPTVIEPRLSLQYFYYYGCLPGNISTVCIRRDCLDKLGLFDETLQVANDYELWVRVCRHYNLGVLHKYLVQLRLHARQLSRADASKLAFIPEQRRIRESTLSFLPKDIRSHARRYTKSRHNVWDVHYAMRCALSGRAGTFVSIVRAMGAGDFALGALFWLLTANNHLWSPRPRFATPR